MYQSQSLVARHHSGEIEPVTVDIFLDVCTQVILLGRIKVLRLGLESCAIRFLLRSNKATHV